MSQAFLFGIGVCVFALTVVGAMVYGRFAFTRFYDLQVADAHFATEAALRSAAASLALAETPTNGRD